MKHMIIPHCGQHFPASHAWPQPGVRYSNKDKLVRLLPLSNGIVAELGALNIPIASKNECRVLYVDHLDTGGYTKKCPTITASVPFDRPMANNSLKDTLCFDAPLDFLVALFHRTGLTKIIWIKFVKQKITSILTLIFGCPHHLLAANGTVSCRQLYTL